MSDGVIKQVDYNEGLSPENTVRISDINKEIAVDWKNRKREEKISMAKSIGHKGDE